MAARTDFAYLHRLAVGPEDHTLLERIAADRKTVLSGGTLSEPGEPLRLSLRMPPEGGTDGVLGPDRRQLITLNLRSDLAPASLDTFLEIFRDQAHTKRADFRGENLATDTVVLDLGANEGYYTLRMKLAHPGIRVVAVEPLAENMELTRRNLSANGIDGVETVPVAVGGKDGETALETVPHVGTVASTDISAFPRPWIRPERVRRRIVPMITLPALVERLPSVTNVPSAGGALLKLDVEGSEDEILAAGRTVLGRFDRVCVECHGTEKRERVATVMASEGFDCVYAEGKRSGDLYFTRRRRG